MKYLPFCFRGLEKRGYMRSNMHVIGFSLGGKVSAQVGEILDGQLARITGRSLVFQYFVCTEFLLYHIRVYDHNYTIILRNELKYIKI